MCLNKMAIFYQACLIPFTITFFEIFNQLAWIFVTFKTVGQRFFFDTVFYFAFAAMLRFSFVAVQTTGTRFFVVAMLITDLTVHSTWSEHTYINFFFGHFHSYIHSFRFAQAQNVMKMVSLSLFFLYNSSCRELGILQITGR